MHRITAKKNTRNYFQFPNYFKVSLLQPLFARNLNLSTLSFSRHLEEDIYCAGGSITHNSNTGSLKNTGRVLRSLQTPSREQQRTDGGLQRPPKGRQKTEPRHAGR